MKGKKGQVIGRKLRGKEQRSIIKVWGSKGEITESLKNQTYIKTSRRKSGQSASAKSLLGGKKQGKGVESWGFRIVGGTKKEGKRERSNRRYSPTIAFIAVKVYYKGVPKKKD